MGYARFLAYALFNGVRLDRWVWMVFLLSRGYSMGQVALAKVVFDVTVLATEVPTGYLADRFGKKPFLAAGSLTGLASALVFIRAHSFLLVAVGMALRALTYTLPSGSDRAYLHDAVIHAGDCDRFSQVLSRYASAGALGLFIAGLVGGFLADHSWTHLYAGEAVFASIGALVALQLPSVPSIPDETGSESERAAGVWHSLRSLRLRAGLLVLVGIAALYWSSGTVKFLLAQPLLSRRGLGPGWIAAALSVTDLLTVVGARIAARLSGGTRRRAIPWLAAGESALTVLLVLPALASTLFALASSQVLGAVTGVVLDSRILDEAPRALRSTLMSLVSSSTSLLTMAIFPVLGAVSDRFGLQTALLSVTGLFAVVAIVALSLAGLESASPETA